MTGRSTFVDRTEQCAARITLINPRINSVITDLSAGALAHAFELDKKAAAGEWPGLLYGLPLSIKDSIDVGGARTTFGSIAFAKHIAKEDATVVSRARAAGAVIIAKDNLNEWCYGGTTQNDHFGICRNPWDTTRIPGGSSGGSAASVAAGLSDLAFGSDTGGSVRMPSALCGIAGLRPTLGRISSVGTVSVTSHFDTIGPMAYHVSDVARAFAAVAGFDERDPLSRREPATAFLARLHDGDLTGITIGIPKNFFYDDLDPAVATCTAATLKQFERLGATLVDVQLDGAEHILEEAARIAAAEVAYRHRDRILNHPKTIGPEVLRRMKTGFDVSGIEIAAAVDKLMQWKHTVRRVLDRHATVIATPTTPITAPPITASGDMIATTRRLLSFTYPFSPVGVPALTVPCGFDGDGLPIGIQLVGAPLQEPTLLRMGVAFQDKTAFHESRPDLS